MPKLRSLVIACVLAFTAGVVLDRVASESRALAAPGPTVIGFVTTLPALNVTPSGVVSISSANTLELTGRASGGAGTLHLLRKVMLPTGDYQFRPWYEDRPIDPLADATASGYFSARYTLPNPAYEAFVLYNPAGALTVDGTIPVVARGLTY